MNALLEKWCTLTDELMKRHLVLSQSAEKSIIDAETGLAVIQITLLVSAKAFTEDYIDSLADVSDE